MPRRRLTRRGWGSGRWTEASSAECSAGGAAETGGTGGGNHPCAGAFERCQGAGLRAVVGDLDAGQKHPAQSVRLVAQRRLAERAEAITPVLALLKDAKAPAYARWSAIWTLD